MDAGVDTHANPLHDGEVDDRRQAPVLVTGGAGYIGSLLVRRLLNRGERVRVLDRLLYGDNAIRDILSHPHLEMVVADFRDAAVAVDAVAGVRAVIHLGAIVGDPACTLDERFTVDTNLRATSILAYAAQRAGVRRFIFGSTCSVYGASDDQLDETSSLNPVSLYASTKIAAERALLDSVSATFSPVVMRFATAYGHSYRPRYDLAVNIMTAKAVAHRRVTIHGGAQWRPFVHADDIARALILALDAPDEVVAGEIFNVGSDEQNHQLREVGEIIGRLIPQVVVVTDELAADKRNYFVRFGKIRTTLGFVPEHTLAGSIVEMAAVLMKGAVGDYQDKRYNNYQYLRRVISEVVPLPRAMPTDRHAPPGLAASLLIGGDD